MHHFLRGNLNGSTATYSSRVLAIASSCPVARPTDTNFEYATCVALNSYECSSPVRVVRGHESQNSYCGKVYTYDGLYKNENKRNVEAFQFGLAVNRFSVPLESVWYRQYILVRQVIETWITLDRAVFVGGRITGYIPFYRMVVKYWAEKGVRGFTADRHESHLSETAPETYLMNVRTFTFTTDLLLRIMLLLGEV
ncbi:hypothetical protein MUK42_14926 [Musa troglodytarum]|uniref:YDG domain-containing protein n=1 Tax=Musa troglodytarum TaxID=320322 RepID=A0A9E7H794_9LILI|nr:hypothetical protein MUK42_14926 [Musa troglodytarum]